MNNPVDNTSEDVSKRPPLCVVAFFRKQSKYESEMQFMTHPHQSLIKVTQAVQEQPKYQSALINGVSRESVFAFADSVARTAVDAYKDAILDNAIAAIHEAACRDNQHEGMDDEAISQWECVILAKSALGMDFPCAPPSEEASDV